MKFIVSGDWHLTNKKPRARTDNYVRAINKKVLQIFSLAGENDAVILQPGDLTDDWDYPDKFKTEWIQAFRLYAAKMKIITIPGQHDLRYHTSDFKNTPFGVITEGAEIQRAMDIPRKVTPDVHVYGAWWGKDVPKIEDKNAFNILLIHRLVLLEKIWEGQDEEDFVLADSLLRENDYDLIVSGDNHKSLNIEVDQKRLINCGSLMRSKLDQSDHHPCVWLIDTEDKDKWEQIFLDVEPFDEVFDVVKAKAAKAVEKQKNESLKKLKYVLEHESRITGLNYRRRVMKRVISLKDKTLISPVAESIINEVME